MKWVKEYVAGIISSRLFVRSQHNRVSSGTASGNLPIVTGSDGKIDDSFLDIDTTDVTGLAEFIADTAGAMFTGNTETDISATYQDSDNTVDLVVSPTIVGDRIHAATGKTTPVDADEWAIADSAASFVLKKVTGTNLKAYLKPYLDTLYGLLATANSWTAANTYTVVSATPYVATDATHNAIINVENSSNTTGSSAGIGYRANTTAAGIQRAFLGIISSVTGGGTEFALKVRTGASTYAEAWRVDGNLLTRFGGTVHVDGFSRYTFASKTIATGVITATTTWTVVDTQGAAAADDLDTINGGATGDLIIVSNANSARSVTLKDGTGNISCGGDRVLTHVDDRWVGIYNGARWCELSYANNA